MIGSDEDISNLCMIFGKSRVCMLSVYVVRVCAFITTNFTNY